ncbi:hypothetical protein ABZ471_41460 [Streptomyces sp. NPDC005728]|uniref:hypothetical protein n=1 Tax=Streptomyces sp. NPDC005728 TaxID=3157054 RepID=UPI0033F8AC5F
MGHTRTTGAQQGRRAFAARGLGVLAGLVVAGTSSAVAYAAKDEPARAARLRADDSEWRFCERCYGMIHVYVGLGVGRCPGAGDGHYAAGYQFRLPYNVPETATAQADWRYCQRCLGLFYFGYPGGGWCPAGGSHLAKGYDYVLPHDVVETPTSQAYWRFCTKCYALFYWGYPTKGRCPAGDAHEAAGYNFVIPHF